MQRIIGFHFFSGTERSTKTMQLPKSSHLEVMLKCVCVWAHVHSFYVVFLKPKRSTGDKRDQRCINSWGVLTLHSSMVFQNVRQIFLKKHELCPYSQPVWLECIMLSHSLGVVRKAERVLCKGLWICSLEKAGAMQMYTEGCLLYFCSCFTCFFPIICWPS